MPEELILTTPSQLKSLLIESVSIALKYYKPTQDTVEPEPFGDFGWLCSVYPAPPASIRVKSAAGLIPGTKRVGKRVIYEKASVLNWLQSHPDVTPCNTAEIERTAEAQVNARITELSGKDEAEALPFGPARRDPSNRRKRQGTK